MSPRRRAPARTTPPASAEGSYRAGPPGCNASGPWRRPRRSTVGDEAPGAVCTARPEGQIFAVVAEDDGAVVVLDRGRGIADGEAEVAAPPRAGGHPTPRA